MPQAACKCDGFEDCFSYTSGHYTRTVHDDDCEYANAAERAYEKWAEEHQDDE